MSSITCENIFKKGGSGGGEVFPRSAKDTTLLYPGELWSGPRSARIRGGEVQVRVGRKAVDHLEGEFEFTYELGIMRGLPYREERLRMFLPLRMLWS
eukprot:scaffold128_cov248-Pinguiococcus_pyrenoidosus.AAC.2